jgi:hypothetical protein
MAYLYRRNPERVEIRESRATPRGPRSRTLATFRGALTREILDRAARRATRRFDRNALIRRARAIGIPVRLEAHEREARAVLARLRRADPIDPVIAGLLLRALDGVETKPLPEELADVGEWIGASAQERGAAIRDLLDTYGTIAMSRPQRRKRPRRPFPRISSLDEAS